MNSEPKPKPNIIYIDCTETFFSGLNTGIQRVVTQIIARSSLLSTKTGIPCVPVVGSCGKYYRLKDMQLKQLRQKKILESLLKIKKWIRDIYYQFKTVFVSKHTSAAILNEEKNEERNDLSALICKKIKNKGFLIKFEQKIRSFVGKLFSLMSKIVFKIIIRNSPSVRFGSESLLLVPDGFFGRYFDFVALENAFNARVNIIPLIYDLFPITHPELCHEENVRIYPPILEKVLRISTGLMTISESGLKDLQDYLFSRHPKYSHLPLRFFYLGGDFRSITKSSDASDNSLNKLPIFLEKRRFYLVVGTIEPRKDHLTILSAFELLWAEGFDASLVFVGRIGWKCEEVLLKMKNSKYNNNQLHFLGSVDDEVLFTLYMNAEALIFSSIAEGFGLPLVEAMNMKIPVIASDIPVFREIGGNYPYYFNVQSPVDLVRVVAEFDRLKLNSEFPQILAKKWDSWDDASLAYIQNALDIYSKIE